MTPEPAPSAPADRPRRHPGRIVPPTRRMALLVAVLGVIALVTTTLVAGPGAPRRAPAPAPLPTIPGRVHVQAQVTVNAAAAGLPIASSFLGFSTEYWTLPVDERHIALYRRILEAVHVPGAGPFTLRIGGDSSDHSFWDPTFNVTSRWTFRLSAAWLDRTARIVRENHLHVIIDLNFITGTPQTAAAWAQAAERDFPPHSIVGFEIGNEPDLYERNLWTVNLGGTGFNLGALPQAITAASYAAEYRAYARTLGRVAPGVPLFGPALAEPSIDRRWISTLLARPHPRLAAITVHEYPYSACVPADSAAYPTVARLLSPSATARMAAAVAPAARLAHAAGLPLRLTEFNSVTCGGVDGVSNTFATALWVPDALFTLARAGASSADLHVRVFSVNAPFRFHGAGIFARPLLYGLVLFTRMLGPDSAIAPVRVHASVRSHLTVWAVTHGGRSVSVLLLNRGPRSLNVRVRLSRPNGAPATVQRLLAPSAASTRHVTLDGQDLGRSARWVGRRALQSVPAVNGSYVVAVRQTSAALLSFPVAPRSDPRRASHHHTLRAPPQDRTG